MKSKHPLRLKKIFLALGLFCTAGMVNAGAMGPVAEPVTWNGPFIGANLGWGGMETTWGAYIPTTSTNFPGIIAPEIVAATSGSHTDTAFLGGIHLGYDYQFNSPLVLGLELDANFGDFTNTRTATTATTEFDISEKTSADMFGSIQARVGFAAIEKILPYFTAGVMMTKMDSFVQTCNAAGTTCNNPYATETSRAGLIIGGGIDYRIADRWSVGMQGTWANPSRQYQTSNAVFGGVALPNSLIDNRSDSSMYAVVARITYRPSMFTNIE